MLIQIGSGKDPADIVDLLLEEEERLILPAIRALLPPEEQAAMLAELRSRRLK
jgi:hypothetical protein